MPRLRRALTSLHRIWVYDCATWVLRRTLALDSCAWGSLAFLTDDVVAAGAVNGSLVAWAMDDAPTCVLGSSSVWSLAGTGALLASGACPPPSGD